MLFWSAIKIASTIQHGGEPFHMVSSAGEVTAEQECQRWEEKLSGGAEGFEEDAVGLAVTGLCRHRGNAEQGWDNAQMTRKEAFWRQTRSGHRRRIQVTVWRKAPFGSSPEVTFPVWVMSQ